MVRVHVLCLVVVVSLCFASQSGLGADLIGWARNDSTATPCAEVDNVNVPLFAEGQLATFTVLATHPQYWIEPSDFPCPAIWEDCAALVGGSGAPSEPERWTKLWDDGQTVLEVSYVPGWWRGSNRAMLVEVNGRTAQGHYLRVYQKISDANSWPQVLVLYADGNARLKPQPPAHMPDTCFGTSIIIGPATPGDRPFADISGVVFEPSTSTLAVSFADGQTATLIFSTSRAETSLLVRVGYETDSLHPFAILRSMFVRDGRSDVDSIQTSTGEVPVLSNWSTLPGSSWFFHRNTRSDHNTCAPDLTVTLPASVSTACSPPVALSLPGDAQTLFDATLVGFESMVNSQTLFPLDKVNATTLKPVATGFSVSEVGLALLKLVCERDLSPLSPAGADAFERAAADLLTQLAALPRPEVSRRLINGQEVRAQFFHSFYIPGEGGFDPGPGLGALDNANLAVALAIVTQAFAGTDSARLASGLLMAMDFRLFLTADESWLSLGYLPESETYEPYGVGQWGSEGILAVLLAIAKDGADPSLLVRVAQASPPVSYALAGESGITVPGYAGGMWVRLFPLLFLAEPDLDARLIEDARQYVRSHLLKGRELGVPYWGWSPCSLVVGDYGEFGVPEVAQYGHPATDLVTPYASLLALGALSGYSPASAEIAAACANLNRIASVPCAFDLQRGFADVLDPKTGAVGPNLISLDKGIELVCIYNFIQKSAGKPGIGGYFWSYLESIGAKTETAALFAEVADALFAEE
jgi:hypothetical protein